MKNNWLRVTTTDQISRPDSRQSIVIVGLEECGHCDLVKLQALEFARLHPGCELYLYKVNKEDWPNGQIHAYGQEVRFFPTSFGFLEGDPVFKLQGAALKSGPLDVDDFVRGFERNSRAPFTTNPARLGDS